MKEQYERMRRWERVGLLIYFIFLIVGSLYVLVTTWNTPQFRVSDNIREDTQTIDGPGSNRTIISNLKNQTTEIKNVTSTLYSDNTTIINSTLISSQNNPGFIDVQFLFSSNEETRLVLLSILFGVLGGSIHGIGSLVNWIAWGTIGRSYGLWYLSLPLIGGGVAVIVYLILRAGFITGEPSGGPSAISYFGVAGLSGLVGLFADPIIDRLEKLVYNIFGGLPPQEIKHTDKNIILGPQDLTIRQNEVDRLFVILRDNSNNPLPNVKVEFIIDRNIISPLTSTHTQTDAKGIASLKIQGKKEEETSVIAISQINEERFSDSTTVTVGG